MDKKLANGVTISYLDESKCVAGDRWLVKLRCRATIPIQAWMRDLLVGEDPQVVYCREQFGEHVVHEVVRERNFIAESEKELVFAELANGLEDNVLGYLAKEAFVRQLFAVRLAEFTDGYALQSKALPMIEADDPPGPVDFSSCFR